MKKLIAIICALTLPLTNVAYAQTQSADTSAIDSAVATLITELNTVSDEQSAEEKVGEAALTASTAQLILGLRPADYNAYILKLLERYALEPANRDPLFKLLGAMQAGSADELADRKRMEEGAGTFIGEGTYYWGGYIFLGVMLTRGRAARLFRSTQRVTQAATPSLARRALTAGSLFGASAAGGAAAGALEYYIATQRTHRLDPILLANLVQMSVGCELSFAAAMAEVNALTLLDEGKSAAADYAKVNAEITRIKTESALLLEQFPRLERLPVDDYLLGENLEHLPPEPQWQELRYNLLLAQDARDGMCGLVALTSVENRLNEISALITNRTGELP